MIVERSMHEGWLSNTYVVADELGGSAVMIDAGGPVEPLLSTIRRGQFNLNHVLLTHHHHDHVAELGDIPPSRIISNVAKHFDKYRLCKLIQQGDRSSPLRPQRIQPV